MGQDETAGFYLFGDESEEVKHLLRKILDKILLILYIRI